MEVFNSDNGLQQVSDRETNRIIIRWRTDYGRKNKDASLNKSLYLRIFLYPGTAFCKRTDLCCNPDLF